MPYAPGVQDISGQLLGAGIEKALGVAGASIEKAAEAWQKKAKEATHLRGLLSGYNPDGAARYKTQGLPELREEAARYAAQAEQTEAKLKGQQFDINEEVLAAHKRTAEQAGARVGFMEALASASSPDKPLSHQDIVTALSRSGYQASPDELSHLLRVTTPNDEAGDATYTEDPETGHRYVQYRRTLLPSGVNPQKVAPGATGQPKELPMEDGKPSGWAVFPDGKYRRLPKQEDALNASQFDTDNDGVLSNQEWAQAILAQKLGGVYPGMKVNAAKAPAAEAKGGSLVDQFRNWKKSKQ